MGLLFSLSRRKAVVKTKCLSQCSTNSWHLQIKKQSFYVYWKLVDIPHYIFLSILKWSRYTILSAVGSQESISRSRQIIFFVQLVIWVYQCFPISFEHTHRLSKYLLYLIILTQVPLKYNVLLYFSPTVLLKIVYDTVEVLFL